MEFEGIYVSLEHDYSDLVAKALCVYTYGTCAISFCVGSFALLLFSF